MIEETAPVLPADRPRYLMGVGTPEDLLEAVARGIDMFDCVMPTRNGRHGMAFTRFGQINLRNARHADDPRPLDEESPWPSTRELLARLSASSGQVGRDAGRDAAVGNQCRLLPAPDGMTCSDGDRCKARLRRFTIKRAPVGRAVTSAAR